MYVARSWMVTDSLAGRPAIARRRIGARPWSGLLSSAASLTAAAPFTPFWPTAVDSNWKGGKRGLLTLSNRINGLLIDLPLPPPKPTLTLSCYQLNVVGSGEGCVVALIRLFISFLAVKSSRLLLGQHPDMLFGYELLFFLSKLQIRKMRQA